jgi:hypothetical protein
MDLYSLGKEIQDIQARLTSLESSFPKPNSQGNFCLPRSAGISETKAKQMQAAIEKIFDDNKVRFDPRVMLAICYSTDASG